MSKKQSTKRKDRTISVRVTATNTFNQLRFNSATGEVTALMDGVEVDALSNTSVSVSYARPKGPKVVAEIAQGSGKPYMTPYSFIEQFDVIFAIDTNTRVIDGRTRHASAMSILEKQAVARHPDGAISEVTLHESMFMNFETALNDFKDANPEVHCWMIGIEEGVKKHYKKYSDSLRIGLVVDSELARHSEYNQRTIPICAGYFLPANFTLLYASADTGSDLPLNKLLMYCDKEAGLQLDAIEGGGKLGGTLIKLEGSRRVEMPDTPYRL